MDETQRKERKRRNRKRRIIVYGGLFLAVYGLYLWQPYEIDFIPRALPSPNPPVEPDVPRLFSKDAKVLVVTAHPDDSAFYIGGFLTQLGRSGAQIHQIICTDGDKAYYGPFADGEELRKVRRAEAMEELRAWHGQDVWFLARPDGRMSVDDALVARIRKEIDRVQPDYIVCFDSEYPPRMSHRDHRRSGEAAEKAAGGAPSVKFILRFSTLAPNWVRDISADWDAQRGLLQIHKSQFNGTRLQRVTNMVESSAVEDGDRIGTTYAEGFRVSARQVAGRSADVPSAHSICRRPRRLRT